MVEAPLGPDLRIDLGVLEDAFRPGPSRAAAGRPFLLCSPHNPTGTVHTADELAAVAALAERYGVRVVADEIHAPARTTPDARFVPYPERARRRARLSLMSASKGWNLAGLKAALAVAGPGAAGDLERMPEEVGHGPSHVGVLAHTAALRDGTAWLDAVLAGLDENRRLLTGLLAERLPGVVHRPGDATYLAWLDCRAMGLGDDPAEVFLDRGRGGPQLGIPLRQRRGAGHVRLNLRDLAGGAHGGGAQDGVGPGVRRGRRRAPARGTPRLPDMDDDASLDRLGSGKYLLVTTYRKNGTPVATPVWVVRDGDALGVWTVADSWKVKRVRNRADVLVGPCDVRGRPTGEQVPRDGGDLRPRHHRPLPAAARPQVRRSRPAPPSSAAGCAGGLDGTLGIRVTLTP